MNHSRHRHVAAISPLIVLLLSALAGAQPLGSFTWQLQPFCNRVTVSIRQDGAVYTLDGFDDQCGALQRATLVGLATPNPDGTIGFGLNIVTTGGKPVHVDARVLLPAGSGTWTDSAGNAGAFVFGANTGGSARPAPAVGLGDITGVAAGTGLTGGGPAGDVTLSVDPSVVQTRVTQACPAGQAVRTIAQNGAVTCEPVSGGTGDITSVNAGVGLTGGALTGDATLAVVFAGDGVLGAAARADHEHVAPGTANLGIGPGALVGVTPGSNNTAVGSSALTSAGNTSASNTAFGTNALQTTVSGDNSTAVGRDALRLSTVSSGTAVGAFALDANTTGLANTAVGRSALGSVTTGGRNTAMGLDAGAALTTGSDVTVVGASANAGTNALTNATAIGANAQVDVSNALVLGSINGINGATADVDVGIGTTTPAAKLDVRNPAAALDVLVTTVNRPVSFDGRSSGGTLSAPLASSAFTGLLSLLGSGHDGVAYAASAGVAFDTTQAWTPTAHGTRILFLTTPNNSTALGIPMVINHDAEVGIGTITPATLRVGGTVRVDTLGTAGATTLCRNATNQIATCSSSLRYKDNVAPYAEGLSLIRHLRPISFTWKQGGMRDVGFGAEDVAAIDPRLAVFDDQGVVEGVKYDRLTTVLVNAVKELEDRLGTMQRDRTALEQRLLALEAALASTGRR